MIRCDRCRENLKAYIDGELPLTARAAAAYHLLRCGDCRREKHAMTDLSNTLKASDAGTLDDALKMKILGAMPDAAPDVSNDLPPLRRPINRKRIPAYAFGASATALVGWFVLYPYLPSTQEAARQQAASPNGKQLGLGAMQYAQDYDSQYATQSAHLGSPSKAYTPVADSDSVLPAASAPIPAAPKAESPSAAYRRQNVLKPDLIGGVDTERKVHREASLTLEVDKTEAKSETVSTMTKTAGGYVASDELQTQQDGTKTASLTLKIPVTQFESFLAQLSHLGDVKAKTLSGEDITEKTSDQEQTVRVVGDDAQELEKKIQRARHASRRDEEALRQLRIREAQAQAHLKLLRALGTLADITVELREKPKTEAAKPQTGGFIGDLNDTAHNAISTFSQAARLPIVLLIWAVVYLPLFLVLLVAYRFVSRFWTRHEA